MSDPYTHRTPHALLTRRDTVATLLQAIALAVLFAVIIGFAVFRPTVPEPAAGHSLTSVTNSGIPGALGQGITVVRDNGSYAYPVPGGSAVWGVKAIRVERGTCVSINGAAPRCAIGIAPYNVALGINSYYVRRTR